MKKEILSERSELFEPDARIHFLFELNGRPDNERLTKAVEQAFHINETTMSRIQLHEDGSAEYIRIDECRNTVTVADEDYLSIIQQEQNKALDIWNGEMMKVFILPGEDATCLLIMANHLAGDGMSMVYFAEDVIRILNADDKEKIVFKPMNLLTADTYPLNGRMKMKYRCFIALYNWKWRKCGIHFSREDYLKLYQTYWEKNPSQVCTHHFTKEQTERILQKAREYSVSVTSLLGAVFAMAIKQTRRGNKRLCEMGAAVNIREQGDYSLTNQVAGTRVRINLKKQSDLQQYAGLFQKTIHMKNKKEQNRYFVLRFISKVMPSLYDSVFFTKYGLLQNPVAKEFTIASGYDDKTMRAMGITNLTKLDFACKNRDYYIKDCIFIPPAVSYADCILGVVTTDLGMNLSFRYRQNSDAADKKELWEKGIAMLQEVIASC